MGLLQEKEKSSYAQLNVGTNPIVLLFKMILQIDCPASLKTTHCSPPCELFSGYKMYDFKPDCRAVEGYAADKKISWN